MSAGGPKVASMERPAGHAKQCRRESRHGGTPGAKGAQHSQGPRRRGGQKGGAQGRRRDRAHEEERSVEASRRDGAVAPAGLDAPK